MKSKPSRGQLRNFGYLIGIFFPLLIGLIFPYLTGHDFRIWTLFIGIPILILGIISPNILKYPYKVWIQLGAILGWLNSSIILGLVFILILQPMAFIMKLFGYDPLKLKEKNLESYKENKSNFKTDLNKLF